VHRFQHSCAGRQTWLWQPPRLVRSFRSKRGSFAPHLSCATQRRSVAPQASAAARFSHTLLMILLSASFCVVVIRITKPSQANSAQTSACSRVPTTSTSMTRGCDTRPAERCDLCGIDASHNLQATRTCWCASAAPCSATATWWWTPATSCSCGTRGAPSPRTSRTPCSSRQVKVHSSMQHLQPRLAARCDDMEV
jgi:hypothetical protein